MGVEAFTTKSLSDSLRNISEKKIDLVNSTKDKMSSIQVNFRITQNELSDFINQSLDLLREDSLLKPFSMEPREFVVCANKQREEGAVKKFDFRPATGPITKMIVKASYSGVVKMQVFAGEEDSGWLGDQEENIRRTEEFEIPKQLNKIRFRVGENESGSFLCMLEFHGKYGSHHTRDFNTGWGAWKTCELKRGEQLLGFEGDHYTNEDND